MAVVELESNETNIQNKNRAQQTLKLHFVTCIFVYKEILK